MNAPKRQHFVPRVLLRRFAQDERIIRAVNVTTGREFETQIENVAVEKYLYSPGVPRDFTLETALANLEGRLGRLIDRIGDDGYWPLSAEDRSFLCVYAGVQWTRTPATLEVQRQVSDRMARQTFEEVLGFESFRAGMGSLDMADDDVKRTWQEWRDRKVAGYISDEPTWSLLELEGVNDRGRSLYARRMFLVRFERCGLVTSDRGMGLTGPLSKSGEVTVGLLNADRIVFPLTRRILVMWTSQDDPGVDVEIEPSVQMANAANIVMSLWSMRFIFHHPDDKPFVPLGA